MPPATHEGIGENLRFLILEVRKQLAKTREYLREPDEELIESVLRKDDYIDNLKDIIQRKCFELAGTRDDVRRVDELKAFDQISVNLERIADFCVNILAQAQYVEHSKILSVFDFSQFFDPIEEAVGLIEQALFQREVKTALLICRSEYVLDKCYEGAFRTIIKTLERGECDVPGQVTALFIHRYLERIGDSLLNIGEAVISACLGEQIKIDRFWALEESLDNADFDEIAEVELEPVGETRSGCKISRVRRKAGPEREQPVIFKEGRIEKLQAERRAIARWQELVPGLVPEIYSFQDQEDHAAILFEYLTGNTFEELLLHGEADVLESALDSVCGILPVVWKRTREDRPASAKFMAQLAKRLPDVFALHHEFRQPAASIASIEAPAFESLVERARPLDAAFPAPFSVFIHGDFNVDNVIFDEHHDKVRFIDVHRSRMMDYVQDVSVFLVSNHRLQVFEAPVRRRINSVVLRFYRFVRDYAREAGDSTFGLRLGLGLARSFATSTRFVLDPEFAKSMFMRSRYLLEQVLELEDAGTFELPEEVLVD